MDIDTALDLAYSLRRQYNQRHCEEADCRVCAVLTLADALKEARRDKDVAQRASIHLADHARKQEERADRLTVEAKARGAGLCPTCKNQLVDGICGVCDQ